jgi:predicted chitinase
MVQTHPLHIIYLRVTALVTFEEFVNGVVGTSHGAPSEAQYNAFIAGLHNGLISTKQEAAMALTHFIHESDGLVAKREYRCENNGCPGDYETAGCDVDGQDYYGRGYIQLTWCFNYQPCSYDLFGDDRLVQDPDQVARDEQTAWNAAFWYWKTNVHDKPGVQEGQFGATTRYNNYVHWGFQNPKSISRKDCSRMKTCFYFFQSHQRNFGV